MRPSRGGIAFDRPCGFLDSPQHGDELPAGIVQIRGWCLFPGSSVARVEVAVGDAPPRRARLATPRPDLLGLSTDPAAPVAGFELMAEVRDAPRAVPVRARALARDGRTLDLAPVEFRLRPADDTYDDDAAAVLRARSVANLRPRSSTAGAGLRLLVFSHQLPYGGASLYLVETLRRFTQMPGFECTVVTLEDGPLRAELEELGIPVHLTEPFPVTSTERYEGNVAQLVAWAAQQRFDVVLANTLACFAGVDVAARLGLPSAWAIHESFGLPLFWSTSFTPGSVAPYVRRRTERLLRAASAVVFEAEATRRLYLGNAAPDRLVTLPYGVEVGAIRAFRAAHDRANLRRALGLPERAKVLLCLGTIEARKSQAMLVQAFAQVAERHPDAMLALVGESDAGWCREYRESLREFVRRAGLEERVRIEPVTSDPYPWHGAADIHVCASDIESLPRSVLEAMAFEVPVVSTDVFGVPEVIEHGVTGYLCRTRDSGALADTLDAVLAADPAELQQVGHAAARHVERHHDASPYADSVWALLNALARDPGALPEDLLPTVGSEREAAR